MNILRSTALVAAGTLAILTTFTARAQNGEAGAGSRPERPLPPIVAALDADKNGEIDAAEIANAAVALKALDKNGDGKLSADEIRPARREGGRGAGGGGPKGERSGRGKAASH